MLSKSGKILMSLNSEQKSPCQLATTELHPIETKKWVAARKWQKRVWVWCLLFLVYPTTPTRNLMITNCSVERSFSNSEELKMNQRSQFSAFWRGCPHQAFAALKVTNIGKHILMTPRWFCYEEDQDKTFLIVDWAQFNLARFDDCSFLKVFQ